MGSFIFCCILWLNDCWSKLHVLHLEYYWGWKAARTTKEQNFQAVFHICSTTQVCSKVIWGIQAVNSKWKREWHRYEKKKTKSEVFFIILDSFLQLYHCIAVIPQQNQGLQIVLEQLHSCSCALATWGNPGELREVDQRWFPTLAHWFQSEGAKDQNALGISYCFDYFVPHLGTVGRVFHGFLRTRRLSFLCSECQSTFQEKKKKPTKILLHEQQDWSSSTPDFCGLTPKAPLLWEIRIS